MFGTASARHRGVVHALGSLVTGRADDDAEARRNGAAVSYAGILVPLTASEASDRAVVTAAQLASERKASVTLLVAIEVSRDLPLEALFPDEEHEGRELLRRATAILDEYGVDSHPRLLRSASAASAILAVAEETQPQIIVMAAERRLNGRARIFGDNVRAVLKGARCRVLLVSPWPAGAPASGRSSAAHAASVA
jgi:nucleotide-binding universal stress UspA family protein